MRPRNQQARCVRCGYTGPLRAFEVEVALSADDSGDNDWVINYCCPACEAAQKPDLLPLHLAGSSVGDGMARAAEPEPEGATRSRVPSANPMYDPLAP